MQAADRGFADVLTVTFPAAEALEARRAEAYQGFLELITRAKRSAHLRDDFTSQDLILLLVANAAVVNFAGDAAPDTWRRLVALLIQSFQAPARGPLPDPPQDAALYEAMRRAGLRAWPHKIGTEVPDGQGATRQAPAEPSKNLGEFKRSAHHRCSGARRRPLPECGRHGPCADDG